MRYPYECQSCNHSFEVIKPLSDIDREEACEECQSYDTIRVIALTHFYGANDWDRAEFNPAFGQIVRNRLHRKQLAKERGMEEIGNEPVENVHKHFESQKAKDLEDAWKKI